MVRINRQKLPELAYVPDTGDGKTLCALKWGTQGYYEASNLFGGTALEEARELNRLLGVTMPEAWCMLEYSMFGNWPETVEQFNEQVAKAKLPGDWKLSESDPASC